MVKVTHLNGEEFLVNCDQIEYVDTVSGTVISFVSGRKVRIAETAEELIVLIKAYKRSLFSNVPALITE